MKPICVKGRRVSTFLIQANHITYPMVDTKYLQTLPMWKESYILLQKQKNNQYKLIKFLYCYAK
jgi:hypothetical protein